MQYGWAPEDITGDAGLFSTSQQGFQGSHSLPRELYVLTTNNVVNVNNTLGQLGNSYVSQNSDGTITASTLGIRPLEDVVTGLRNGTTQRSFRSRTVTNTTVLAANASSHMEFSATMSRYSGAVGICVGVSPNGQESTTIMYEPSNNTILVDRSSSSLLDGFANTTVTGYFAPYSVKLANGTVQQEPLVWDVFLDGSLLEVYLNGRFALTTRIYPSMESSTGVAAYVARGASATFESIDLWTDLYNVWPSRPLNSSSQLVFDTANQTNNYVWWS